MNSPIQPELKKEFQLERMILFSDAVFAIAITLLALEIKIPPINRHVATDALLLESLDELVPKFIGFLVSFFLIGLYWTVHHRMFGYVVNYTPRLLWLNLVFLLAVVLMPFSTAFYSEYILRALKTPLLVYATNIIFLGLMNFLLWRHISNPKHQLSEGLDRETIRYSLIRSLLVPGVFFLVTLGYLYISKKAIYLPLVIPLLMRLFGKFYKRKNPGHV